MATGKRERCAGASRAARRVCAMFGVGPEDSGGATEGGRARWAPTIAAEVDAGLARGGIALVTGPSGAGKTTVLRALARRLGRRAVVVRRMRSGWDDFGSGARADRRVIDVLVRGRGAVLPAIAALSRAGLADARVFLRMTRALSDGERARLELAVAMREVEGRVRRPDTGAVGPAARGTLLVDEFGSTLDRPGAARLARSVRRWASASGVRVVCATAHDDVLGALAPDVLVETSLDGPGRVVRRAAARRCA